MNATPPRLEWYGQRLRAMSAAEVGGRIGDRVRQEVWSHRRFPLPPAGPAAKRPPVLPPAADLHRLPAEDRRRLLDAADRLLDGRAVLLGVERLDMADPTWLLDPTSSRRYPGNRCAFRIDYRSPGDRRSVKHVWELSRHQHLTVLAAAWALAGDERYARAVERHLRSWWAGNPVCRGVNWSSGIELGIRLVSWAWARRLLGGWPGAPALFEDDGEARRQIYWHQRSLACFPSRGSSANNHAVAEAAGLLVAGCAFPWFAESAGWQRTAAACLEEALERNTDPDGVNREQAFDYHGLVAELGLVAAAEAEAAGAPLRPATWALLCRMVDVVAAVLDRAGHPPRYGDGDDGRGLVVTAPDDDRWLSLLSLGAALFGPLPWWPPVGPDAQAVLVGGMVGRTVPAAGRPAGRPSHFPAAGLTILRTAPGAPEELWCRCDAGPHGFLSIAAHAHADALSVEVRHDGVEVLVDPGTYCYHGNPTWRRYFRSTLGHNTIELDGEEQSVPGGPFLWADHARTELLAAPAGGGVQRWSAEHHGYRRLAEPAGHRRTVVLDPARRAVEILDVVESAGAHDVRLAFHLGPAVGAVLDGAQAKLAWEGRDGTTVGALLSLPPALEWTAARGAVDPPLGWYSPGYGRREPSTTLVGTGRLATAELRSELRMA